MFKLKPRQRHIWIITSKKAEANQKSFPTFAIKMSPQSHFCLSHLSFCRFCQHLSDEEPLLRKFNLWSERNAQSSVISAPLKRLLKISRHLFKFLSF